jgi:hypothetical protein
MRLTRSAPQPLQPPIGQTLHYFTLQIEDKTDKVFTFRLKPCRDPHSTNSEAQTQGPPSGPQVQFRPPCIEEPCREPFPPGQLPGGGTHCCCSNSNSSLASARPQGTKYNRPLDLQTSGLEIWEEPCRGSSNDDFLCRSHESFHEFSLSYMLHHQFFTLSPPHVL